MLKRTLWMALLCCQLTLAAPLPRLDHMDQPGTYLSAEEKKKWLAQAEVAFRRQANREGLVEVECRRLALMEDGDPQFPARLEALRLQLPELRPGKARAMVYWECRRYAVKAGDRVSENRFEELALAEPDVPAVLKGYWLSRVSRPEKVQAALKAMSALYHSQPSSPLQWYWLGMQRNAERGKDLEFSLALARLQLAEKEGWSYEQFQALRTLRWSPQGEAYRARFEQFPFRLKPSPLRDATILELERDTRELKEASRMLGLLQRPLPEVDRIRELARYRPALSEEARRVLLEKIVALYHRQGEVEKEIAARMDLSTQWNNLSKLGEATKQCKAARQLRLDHPAPDPAWSNQDLGRLTQQLASYLSTQGYRHQARALLEEALQTGQVPRAHDRLWMLRQCLQLARGQGDAAAVERHWLALVDLLPQLPADQIASESRSLAEMAPPTQAKRRSQLLAEARRLAGAAMENGQSSEPQAEYLMAQLLREEGDRAGQLAVWQKLLERGRREGNRHLIGTGLRELIYAYGNNGDFLSTGDREQFARLVRQALQETTQDPRARSHYLWWGCYLAASGDPETLAWADELVRESRNRAAYDQAGALRQRARVQSAFKRHESALASLDEAARLEPTRPGDWLERQRAEILWAADRREEALQVLRDDRDRILASEIPFFAAGDVDRLAGYLEVLGKEWQAEYAELLVRFETLGEPGESGRNAALFNWLKRLAKNQQWERGREVLTRHPWKASPLEKNTLELQSFPAWADLLPGKVEAPAEKPDSLSQVLDELRLGHPELSGLMTLRSTNQKHLQSRLGPRDTLVTYCSVGNQTFVLGLRAEGGFYRKSALGLGELRALQQRYLSELSSEQRGDAEATLYSLLVEPVLAERPDQRLYLVPSGELWQLPFGALRDGQGQSLAARAEVVMLGSADLLRLADNDWKPYQLSQPLAIGAPPGADLPGAYQELEEVARWLPDCQLRRGPQATTDVLYQPGRQWGLLHFASHAHYRADQPTESDIELHDGPLKLKQLSQLSLAERSLVALSCCEGGAAAGQRLDEPVTLATGFAAAGAETVVAHLWRVDDEVARAFFARFYQELAAGHSPGRSFRSAQTECRRAYPNPRDWAGFFLLGNPT